LTPSELLVLQGQHVMTVCNACRYCEGYCPVFPAIESRRVFSAADLGYLANLCHNCGECLYACQYAPPHEFGINVPVTLAKLRLRSYEEYCWPKAVGAAFKHQGVFTALLTPAIIIALLGAFSLLSGRDRLWARDSGRFYDVVPHGIAVAAFGAVSLFVLTALVISCCRFWRDIGGSAEAGWQVSSVSRALRDVATLRHLETEDLACTQSEENRPPWRRRFHHVTFYGFLLCFASTSVAALYDGVFGWRAPYAYTSLPVFLGAVGGLGLLIGPLGLFFTRQKRDPDLADPEQAGLDLSFTILLFVTGLTGLCLLIARNSAAMSLLLLIHLGVVLALFLTLPYGKFVHGIYHTVALIKYELETSHARSEVQESPAAASVTVP
jgi:citrate/tricarballylate utilization protein